MRQILPFHEWTKYIVFTNLVKEVEYICKNLINFCFSNAKNLAREFSSLTKEEIQNLTIADYIQTKLVQDKLNNPNDLCQSLLLPSQDREKYTLKFDNDFNNYVRNQNYQINVDNINNAIIAELFNDHINPSTLEDIDDKIGETIQFDSSFIVDQNQRDGVFVYINHEWEFSTRNTWHAELVTRYLKRHHLVNDLAPTSNSTVRSYKDIEYVTKQIETKEFDYDAPLIFGNLRYNVGMIVAVEKIDAKAAAQLVKQHFHISKVYWQNSNQYQLTRLASL